LTHRPSRHLTVHPGGQDSVSGASTSRVTPFDAHGTSPTTVPNGAFSNAG
jgi:hypothetical protein